MISSNAASVAIVTGGARGIGRACALSLAKAGLDIALVDLLSDELSRTAEEIKALGRRALTFQSDVIFKEEANRIVTEVAGQWGRVDVLVNNAGKGMPKGIFEITEAEFDHTIALNLKSCFNYIQAVAPIMQRQGHGRIVSMSSLNAHSGGVTAAVSRFAYAAAKAGIIGMTRALAKELGPEILINAVCPGIIETEVGNTLTRARGPAIADAGIALKRMGKPDDVAELVTFLATSTPCFITGQDIVVDGFQFNR
ncbi:short-chain dehydrogenase [Bosea sp. Root670]|uniref:SDR family NAD(P)-dependent oxidoreductase n=1 Tax=unclassified Bosea (in: a-proteobacteria) TaxID=2653178 RepID=UPI000712C6A1|nr:MULTISPECIES: SDR family NAD(P)-dependent oxidoreductase [unclassified Bosea (in: a-proteobacteria)]KRE07640.1 short-chain dehydrogenase [Bosea sp. Root670]TQI74501.1 3-oxoacyl-[acyl-carrier protein] reductase [Bosea sp. AK1]